MRDMDIDQLSADGAQEAVRGVTPVEPRTAAGRAFLREVAYGDDIRERIAAIEAEAAGVPLLREALERLVERAGSSERSGELPLEMHTALRQARAALAAAAPTVERCDRIVNNGNSAELPEQDR